MTEVIFSSMLLIHKVHLLLSGTMCYGLKYSSKYIRPALRAKSLMQAESVVADLFYTEKMPDAVRVKIRFRA
jgi:hypothetical protein